MQARDRTRLSLRQPSAERYTASRGPGVSHTAYIGVGTNLGDRLRNYRTALEKIAEPSPVPSIPAWQEDKNLLDWLRSL